MKKLFTLILVVLVLLVGCNTAKPNNKSEKGDFRFCSLEWGTDWETVQKSDILKNAEVLKENGERKTVKLEKGEYLGTPIGDIGLVFDTNGVGDTAGLVSVQVQYEEEYEMVQKSQSMEKFKEDIKENFEIHENSNINEETPHVQKDHNSDINEEAVHNVIQEDHNSNISEEPHHVLDEEGHHNEILEDHNRLAMW